MRLLTSPRRWASPAPPSIATCRARNEARSRACRGWPSVLAPATIEAARRLYDAGHAPAVIATALGVSRATIYRHLPGAE
ncbi:helix-turn-helix domain-containing protein [Amycolatopsis sp. NPDC098790]|uniref:helix-turn-helix domain-containing protein n=1 Tax=Amycolatopsis sp. NPDC098790 TaxID=3363939 RepID=UPI0037F75D19